MQWHSPTGLSGHHASLSGQRRPSKEQYFFQAAWKNESIHLKGKPTSNLSCTRSVPYSHIGLVTALLSHESDHKTHPYVCILQKNALQWTKNPSAADSGDMSGTPTASTATVGAEGAEQESCDSTETTAASGENDGLCTSFFSFFLFATLIHSACFSASEKGF